MYLLTFQPLVSQAHVAKHPWLVVRDSVPMNQPTIEASDGRSLAADCPTGNTEQDTGYDNEQSGYYTPDDWNI